MRAQALLNEMYKSIKRLDVVAAGTQWDPTAVKGNDVRELQKIPVKRGVQSSLIQRAKNHHGVLALGRIMSHCSFVFLLTTFAAEFRIPIKWKKKQQMQSSTGMRHYFFYHVKKNYNFSYFESLTCCSRNRKEANPSSEENRFTLVTEIKSHDLCHIA